MEANRTAFPVIVYHLGTSIFHLKLAHSKTEWPYFGRFDNCFCMLSMITYHRIKCLVIYAEVCSLAFTFVRPSDTLGILIDADPDAMAGALALKRLLWRRARGISIYHINRVRRADNLAFIGLLKVEQAPARYARRSRTTRWAIVDGQPQQREEFRDYPFDIIIDHHPETGSSAPF